MSTTSCMDYLRSLGAQVRREETLRTEMAASLGVSRPVLDQLVVYGREHPGVDWRPLIKAIARPEAVR